MPSHLKLGSLTLIAGQADRAATAARDVLAIEPGNLEAHILLANALTGMRDVREAIRQLEEAIALNPHEAAGYAALGELQWSATGFEHRPKRIFERRSDQIPARCGRT